MARKKLVEAGLLDFVVFALWYTTTPKAAGEGEEVRQAEWAAGRFDHWGVGLEQSSNLVRGLLKAFFFFDSRLLKAYFSDFEEVFL